MTPNPSPAKPDGTTPAEPSPIGPESFEEFTVPVEGGELAVLRWPAAVPDAPVVLALHGITGNALSWAGVAHHLAGRVTLLAPDLRGRAGSGTLPGPYGIARHADDAAALIRAVGPRPVVLAGHSMGAFVATVASVRHPDLFPALLLVDGGVGFPAPLELAPDELIEAVIGPAMHRLSMTFPDRTAYRSFWQAHPAFASSWEPWVDAYIQRDLVGQKPELRSSCRIEAVRTDGVDLFSDDVLAAVHHLPGHARLLWAQRGLMDEPQGLYDEQRLTEAGLDHPNVTPRPLPGTNHYTILIGDDGARTVARNLLDMAGLPTETA